MSVMHDSPIVIIGAGLAGLTAATYLQRHGRNVLLLEAGKQIAGLARSERDAEGFTYDFGAHFITNRLAAAVGCSATCRPMPRYGETVYYRKRCYSYPLGLMRNAGFLASAALGKIATLGSSEPSSAAAWYRQAYGRKLADAIAIPLTEAWSGSPAEELAPSVGEKFATSLPRTLMLKAAGRVTRRTVAVGYSSAVRESPHVWHVYPEGGIGSVCERLADEVRDQIRTQAPAEAIEVESGRVRTVTAGGKTFTASAVVSTVPVPLLVKLIRGSSALTPFAKFRYRAMVFVNLRFRGISGLPDVVTWLPEKAYPFFRLSDIGQGLPWLVPDGFSQITADIGCQVGDETWTANDEDLGKRCLEALDSIVPGIQARYCGCRVMRTPIAYPVYSLDYESERKNFEKGTGINQLVSVGRNGEFSHSLMEDVFWRTRRRVSRLITNGSCPDHGIN